MINNMLEITDREFNQIRDIMYSLSGVFLKPSKKPLIIARLRSRLIELGLKSFADYLPRLKMCGNGEIEIFVNAVTTNETFFFRHENQFKFLKQELFPFLIKEKEKNVLKKIKVWSAACSTGEEPYSIAIALAEFFSVKHDWNFSVLATDVNTQVIENARRGQYLPRSLRGISDAVKRRYFKEVISSDDIEKVRYNLNGNIKKIVEFRRHNLLNHPLSVDNDIVFLRNVMIYFNSQSKQKVISSIERSLVKGGYLFISLSETLNDVESKFKFIKHGIYQKQ